MTDAQYRVRDLPQAPQTLPENRGSRRKYWLPIDGESSLWLLKFPRPRQGQGEHWAEKIAAEVGHLVGIDCARVELARSGGELASICESFDPTIWYDYWYEFGEYPTQVGFLEANDLETDPPPLRPLSDYDALLHNLGPVFWPGSSVLASAIQQYDPETTEIGYALHSVKNIQHAVADLLRRNSIEGNYHTDALLSKLYSYFLLDGLIGNTDRHHDNWMLKYENKTGFAELTVAPSFDHGSSLGRALSDKSRLYKIRNHEVSDYLHSPRPSRRLFWDENPLPNRSPLAIACLLVQREPQLTRRVVQNIGDVRESDFRTIVDRTPIEFMSDPAKEFAYQVLVTSRSELLGSMR